jgi:murein L,D-transpeptidase YcbB/YkuD
VKIVRFERLLASTALGLVLALSSHAGWAQQAADPQVQVNVPLPDPAELPPITANDAPPPAAETVKTETAKPETKPEPAKAEAAPVMTAPAPAATVAVPAAPAPAVATDSATADNAVADKLRETIASKALDRSIGRKADRAGIEAFYSARNYAPLWVANGAASARARSAINYLAKADAVGLDPNDYPTPDFNSAITANALADAELKLTAAALNFARQAQTGRIHFTRVASDIEFNIVAPEPADVLAKLAGGNDAGKVLDSYNPPQAEFKALKAKLAELRSGGAVAPKAAEEKPAPTVHVPSGPILRVGMRDERVKALRKRLDIAGDKDNPLYDEAVFEAVRTFQIEADIGVDGNAGPYTVRALNGGEKKIEVRGPTADPIDTVIVNMERWRWLPRDLGNPHVTVNPADYTLTLWNNGKVYWHSKIVVGKPDLATPMISAEMKFITVNPTWNVPPSIIEKEYLPALEQDPQALERIGLKIEQAADGTVRIYQPPGAANALGRIRFNFPNKFLVYQHDTPDKNLFNKDRRAFSHGCMRVQNPLTYAEKLLSLVTPTEKYTEAKLQSMFGGSEININFPKNIWVHLTYQTAFVDQDGKLQMREDVYRRDARMIAILKSNERKVADIAIERAPNSSSKPVRMPVGMYGGSSYGGGGGNFFEWLFGGAQAAPEYRPRAPVGPRGPNGRVSFR